MLLSFTIVFKSRHGLIFYPPMEEPGAEQCRLWREEEEEEEEVEDGGGGGVTV